MKIFSYQFILSIVFDEKYFKNFTKYAFEYLQDLVGGSTREKKSSTNKDVHRRMMNMMYLDEERKMSKRTVKNLKHLEKVVVIDPRHPAVVEAEVAVVDTAVHQAHQAVIHLPTEDIVAHRQKDPPIKANPVQDPTIDIMTVEKIIERMRKMKSKT